MTMPVIASRTAEKIDEGHPAGREKNLKIKEEPKRPPDRQTEFTLKVKTENQ
jgi:hypothetical protein